MRARSAACFSTSWAGRLAGCACRNPCNGNKMGTGSLTVTPTNKKDWVRQGAGDRGTAARAAQHSSRWGGQALGQRAHPPDSCPLPCLPALQVNIHHVWEGTTATKDWNQASMGEREGTGEGKHARSKVADLTAAQLHKPTLCCRCRCLQMVPIPCPTGFRTASNKDKSAILEPYL